MFEDLPGWVLVAMHNAVPSYDELNPSPTGPWREAAKCRGIDGIRFFPMSDDPQLTAPAKAICSACSVVAECLIFSIVTSQPEGIWGGLTSSERTKLANRLGRQGWNRTEAPRQETIETLLNFARSR